MFDATTLNSSTVLISIENYQLYCMIEIGLFVVSIFPITVALNAFIRIQIFHPNLLRNGLHLLFSSTLMMVLRIAVMAINYRFLIRGEPIYTTEMDVTPRDIVPLLVFYARDACIHCVGMHLVAFVVERCIATFNVMRYERDTRLAVVAYTFFGLWAEAIAMTVVRHYTYLEFRQGAYALIVANLIAFTVYLYVNFYFSKSRRFNDGTSFPSLSERYQLEENLRAAQFITPALICSLVTDTAVVAVLTISRPGDDFSSYQRAYLINFHGFNIAVAMIMIGEAVGFVATVRHWRNEALRMLHCNRLIQEEQHVSMKFMVPLKIEGDVYFRELARSWQ